MQSQASYLCFIIKKTNFNRHISLWGKVLMDRYRIYVDGLAWSVSQKYIMACNSPTLFVNTPWYEFFQRGLIPGRHYWPIPENNMCRAIKLAVDWGNEHQQEVHI